MNSKLKETLEAITKEKDFLQLKLDDNSNLVNEEFKMETAKEIISLLEINKRLNKVLNTYEKLDLPFNIKVEDIKVVDNYQSNKFEAYVIDTLKESMVTGFKEKENLGQMLIYVMGQLRLKVGGNYYFNVRAAAIENDTAVHMAQSLRLSFFKDGLEFHARCAKTSI